MRLIGRDLIEAFVREHLDARSSLDSWARAIEANNFRHLVELKKTFSAADYVKPYTVFNVAGIKYRVVALVDYELQTVSVEHVLKYEECDEQRWRA